MQFITQYITRNIANFGDVGVILCGDLSIAAEVDTSEPKKKNKHDPNPLTAEGKGMFSSTVRSLKHLTHSLHTPSLFPTFTLRLPTNVPSYC